MNGHRSRRQPSSAVVVRCNLEPRAIRILPRSFPNATVVVEGFLFSLLLKQRKKPSARLVLSKQASLTRRQPADQPSGAASSKQKSPRQIRKRNPFPRRAAKADFRCPGPLPPPAHCTVIAKPLAHLTGRRADPLPCSGLFPIRLVNSSEVGERGRGEIGMAEHVCKASPICHVPCALPGPFCREGGRRKGCEWVKLQATMQVAVIRTPPYPGPVPPSFLAAGRIDG